MNQNITEEEVKDYVELTEIGNDENKPDPDKLSKLLSNNRRFPKLRSLKLGKMTITFIIPLIIIILAVYFLIKKIFGYSAKFRLIRVKNKQEISKTAGDIIIDIIQKNSNSKISLSSGILPKSIYKYLIDKFQDKEISFENITFFSLNDLCGLESNSKNQILIILNIIY